MGRGLPTVALVGRPNVGKSTLFNRLLRRRASLVLDQPGITRDRLFGEVCLDGRALRLVDTGGFEPGAGNELLARVRFQTQLAIDEADCVLLVLDGFDGLRPADEEVASLLRKAGKPTIGVVNKVDEPVHDDRLADFFRLGLDDLQPISAEHGRGVGELCDLLLTRLPVSAEDGVERESPLTLEDVVDEAVLADDHVAQRDWTGQPIQLAVVGRPNSGKSSLINRLLGEQRMLASETPGTTRDAVDAELRLGDTTYVLVDTAGMRKKRSIAERVEQLAVMAAVRSIDRADVVLVVCDASISISDQESKIAALAHERGRALVLVANKWDLMPSAREGREWVETLRFELPFVRYAPLVRLSAKTGRGVHRLLPAVVSAQGERHRRIPTGELNRFFKEVVLSHPPPVRRGKRPRLYFVSQPLTRPPTFVFAASHPENIAPSYVNYLRNALRQRYGFAGTPVWVKLRGRKKDRPAPKKRSRRQRNKT